MELLTLTRTEAVLQEYANEVAARYKEQLRQHGRVATNELISSVHTEVVMPNDTTIAVDMDLAAYWRYVEWDTKPHWPPPGCLLKWITAKKIIGRPDKKGNLPTPKQLDFLIRRKISRDGTQGTHDLEDTVTLMNMEYLSRIEDALAEDVGDAADFLITSAF